MRRAARRAIVAAVLGLSALAPRASADNGVYVKVNGGGSVYLTQRIVNDSLDVSRAEADMLRRTAPGVGTIEDRRGTKVSTVVELAGIPRALVRSFTALHDRSTAGVTLSGTDVRDGFPFDPGGLRHATIYTGYGHGVWFFRPVRDETDLNAPDEIITGDDRDLYTELTTNGDTVRVVTASVEDPSPDPDVETGFSASVQGAGDATFTYTWNFGDGTTAVGQHVGRGFPRGHYRVTVTAVGSDESAGVSAPIDVQVGTQVSESPTPTATSTPTGSPAPGSGPGGPGAGGGGPVGGGEGDEDDR